MNIKELGKKIRQAVLEANTSLRKDVVWLLRQAEKKEKSPLPKAYLKAVLENARCAYKEKLAICQDTGLGIVFVELAKDADFGIKEIHTIEHQVSLAYKDFGLRNSVVSPFERRNPQFGPPEIYVEYTRFKYTRIVFMAKGFGSENKTKLFMLNPNEDIEPYVLKAVKAAGPEACPPFIIGIGIGGTSEKALFLAKKALLADLRRRNPDRFLDFWQARLLEKVNSLNIGPMALGGSATALAVRMQQEKTHIAGLPLGVNISCWALRSAEFKI